MKSKSSNTIYSYDGPTISMMKQKAKVKYNPITKRKVVKITKEVAENYNNPEMATYSKTKKKTITTPKMTKVKYK